MNTNIQILPGIRFVGYIDLDKLAAEPRYDLAGICGMSVVILTDVIPVDFFDDPECRNVTEKINGQNQDRVSLKFHSHSLIEIHKNLGFVVTDNAGHSYVIGNQLPPFPQIKFELNCGAPDGDGAGFYYEVTHVALSSLVPCKFQSKLS